MRNDPLHGFFLFLCPFVQRSLASSFCGTTADILSWISIFVLTASCRGYGNLRAARDDFKDFCCTIGIENENTSQEIKETTLPKRYWETKEFIQEMHSFNRHTQHASHLNSSSRKNFFPILSHLSCCWNFRKRWKLKTALTRRERSIKQ